MQMDTINKLLKKQAPRRRGKLLEGTGTLPVHGKDVANTEAGTISPIKPSSLYARWQSSVHGSIVAVPDEWLAAPVGYPLSAIF